MKFHGNLAVKFWISALCVSIAVLSGCSSSPPRQSATVRPYQYVCLGDISIESEETDEDSISNNKKLLEYARADLVRRLENGRFEVVSSNTPRARLVIIEGKMTITYGSRALRWLAGVAGVGKGSAEFTMTAKDAVTSKQLAIQKQNRSLQWSAIAGGSMISATESLSRDVSDDLVEDLLDLRI